MNTEHSTYVDIGKQSAQQAVAQNKVLRQAYMLVAMSLVPTIFGALLEMNTHIVLGLLMKSPIVYFIGTLGLFYGLTFAIEKNKESTTGLVLMFVFTFLMGMLLGPLLSLALQKAGYGIIMTAAGGTAVLFFGLAAVGSDASRDFSGFGKVIGLSVIILMATVVLNFLFLKMPMLSLVISMAIIPLSGMIIVYRINDAVRGGENNYISLALDIYIGLYNIFSAILRILLTLRD